MSRNVGEGTCRTHHIYPRGAVVTYKHVTYKLPRTIYLTREVLVVGDILVVQVSGNVVEFVRWIMWWGVLVVLIIVIITGLIRIPLCMCSGDAFGVTPYSLCLTETWLLVAETLL